MKFNKLAMAAAIVVGSTGIVNAQNTVSVDTDVLVYVAAGLSVEVTTQLKFSDIVVPAAGAANTGMSMDCATGDLTYKTDASTPNGLLAADGGANANANKQDAQRGQIKITGESDYAITVSAVTTNPIVGVSLVPKLGNGSSTTSINRSLNSNGVKLVSFCGEVDVTEDVQAGESLAVPVAITVSYR